MSWPGPASAWQDIVQGKSARLHNTAARPRSAVGSTTQYQTTLDGTWAHAPPLLSGAGIRSALDSTVSDGAPGSAPEHSIALGRREPSLCGAPWTSTRATARPTAAAVRVRLAHIQGNGGKLSTDLLVALLTSRPSCSSKLR